MADNWMNRFWSELHRRKVIRVAVVYAVVAWATPVRVIRGDKF